MDKLKQLESFVSVAERGSLMAAAKAEGLTPAIMGRRLDALEERLGVKLLVCTTRRITLTHEGIAFLEDCQRLLADLANAEANVSAGGVKASGHLRMAGNRRLCVATLAYLKRHGTLIHPSELVRFDRLTLSSEAAPITTAVSGQAPASLGSSLFVICYMPKSLAEISGIALYFIAFSKSPSKKKPAIRQGRFF